MGVFTQSLKLAGVGCLLFTLTACDKELSEMRKDLESMTGLSVDMQAKDEDQCAKEQVKKLIDQYDDLSYSEKKNIQSKFGRYRALQIQSTETSQVLSGNYAELALYHEECHYVTECEDRSSIGSNWDRDSDSSNRISCKEVYRCTNINDARKVLEDAVVKTGADPITQLLKNDTLIVRTQSSKDNVMRGRYVTDKSALYRDVGSINDELFQTSLKYQSITGHAWASGWNTCGATIDLKDLF
jgi:hypothetical protein